MLTICIVPFIVVFPNLSNMASCGAIWVPQMSERYQASGTSQVWGSFILGALTRCRLNANRAKGGETQSVSSSRPYVLRYWKSLKGGFDERKRIYRF